LLFLSSEPYPFTEAHRLDLEKHCPEHSDLGMGKMFSLVWFHTSAIEKLSEGSRIIRLKAQGVTYHKPDPPIKNQITFADAF